MALGSAFLSGVMSRFGWWGEGVGYGSFETFVASTAEVNAFLPAVAIPFLAWAATAAELGLGLALVVGLWPRRTALASSVLLALFGVAMGISFGLKEPLDYSVFSACGAALLLAVEADGRSAGRDSVSILRSRHQDARSILREQETGTEYIHAEPGMVKDRMAADLIGRWLALAAVGLGVTDPGAAGGRDPDTRPDDRSCAGGEMRRAAGPMPHDKGLAPVTDGPFIETKE